jgi:hypothetical protein
MSRRAWQFGGDWSVELAFWWPWYEFHVGFGWTLKSLLGARLIVLQFGVGSLLLWNPRH